MSVGEGFLSLEVARGAPKSQNSLYNSLLAGNLPGDGCDQHCVASQPVLGIEILPRATPEMPANGGLLRIGGQSPGSGFGPFGNEIADSLRPHPGIFPFSGDGDQDENARLLPPWERMRGFALLAK